MALFLGLCRGLYGCSYVYVERQVVPFREDYVCDLFYDLKFISSALFLGVVRPSDVTIVETLYCVFRVRVAALCLDDSGSHWHMERVIFSGSTYMHFNERKL